MVELNAGEEVHAIEETFNSDGTVRLHITRPVEGKEIIPLNYQ